MNSSSKISKFTRGEKCIFIHLVFTFVFILISVIAYFVHLCMVSHIGSSAFLTRRIAHHDDNEVTTAVDYLPIGTLFLKITPPRVICYTIHLREKWSITPAHCAVIRTDPDMSQWLSKWRINYRSVDFKYMVTEIKRSIPHPHFNKEDFSNNIGLLEHTTSVAIHQYTPLTLNVNKNNHMDNKYIMRLAEWTQIVLANKDLHLSHLNLHSVSTMDRVKCNYYVAPVGEIRNYELCVTLLDKINVKLDHGAALLHGNNVTGFFSWGEKQGKILPFIAIHISSFRDWLQNIVSLQNIM